jgi:hypothetical protein
LQSLNLSIGNVVTTFATAITFIVHIYSGNDLSAAQVGTKIGPISGFSKC